MIKQHGLDNLVQFHFKHFHGCVLNWTHKKGIISLVRKSKGKMQTFTAAAFSNFQNVLSLKSTANNHSHQVKISPYIAKLLPKTRRAGKTQLAKVVTFHWKGFCFQNADSINFTYFLSIFLEGTNIWSTRRNKPKQTTLWEQMMSLVFNEDGPGNYFID